MKQKDIRKIAEKDLDMAMIISINEFKKKLISKKLDMHPFTLACLSELGDN